MLHLGMLIDPSLGNVDRPRNPVVLHNVSLFWTPSMRTLLSRLSPVVTSGYAIQYNIWHLVNSAASKSRNFNVASTFVVQPCELCEILPVLTWNSPLTTLSGCMFDGSSYILTSDSQIAYNAGNGVPYFLTDTAITSLTPKMRFLLIPIVVLGSLVTVRAVPTPALETRQAITALSSSQIAAFKPFPFYASAGYCQPSATLAWNCGANCNANPSFKPVASGGDGDETQFCELCPPNSWEKLMDEGQLGFVGFDPTLNTIVVSHQGTDTSEMYVCRLRMSWMLTTGWAQPSSYHGCRFLPGVP